jgi:glycosyltransferase involved in cell wall biosynthesis
VPYLLRTHIVQGCYARAHRLTCPSPFVFQLLERSGFAADRLALVDYGIPALPHGVATAPRPRQPFRFGFLGTCGAHKGLAIALQAIGKLPAGRAKLVVCGGPLRDEELRLSLQRTVAAQRAEYLGIYGAKELPAILAGIDAVLIPSLWHETGPMVWMEASAAGLPVIASRLGALVDRVHDGEDGLLVPAGDATELAAAMERLIGDYERLRRSAIRREVRSLTDVADELLPVYDAARRAAR